MSGDERHEELWRLDAVELAGRIRRGRLTARAAVESALERLHAVNPAINAVVRTMGTTRRWQRRTRRTGRCGRVARSGHCTACR